MTIIKNGWHDSLCIQLLFIQDYELRGNQIILCALMHKYDSIDISMMQKWTGATKQGVIKTINSLIELGLARKEYYRDENNNTRTKYMLNTED